MPLWPRDVVFDVGCGLGRVNFYFAQQALSGCVGIDFDPALIRGAKRNLASAKRLQTDIEFICCDATLADYDAATVIFLFNPFNAEVMEAFLRRIMESLACNPRPLRIVYDNPVRAAVFDRFPALQLIDDFRVPRLGVPVWSPVKLGGDRVMVWEVLPEPRPALAPEARPPRALDRPPEGGGSGASRRSEKAQVATPGLARRAGSALSG